MLSKSEKREIGKKSKRDGYNFEKKVETYLEKDGWIVSRWMKNVEFKGLEPKIIGKDPTDKTGLGLLGKWVDKGKLIPAKPKIRMIPGKGPILVST